MKDEVLCVRLVGIVDKMFLEQLQMDVRNYNFRDESKDSPKGGHKRGKYDLLNEQYSYSNHPVRK